jgi:uncharacterized membrane protein
MKRRFGLFVANLALASGFAGSAIAASYTYTTIDFPGAAESGATGINNLGQIVGGYGCEMTPSNCWHGFVYSGGTFTSLTDTSATNGTLAYGINDNGVIVGAYDLNTDPEGGHTFEGAHAFINIGGVFTTLDYPAADVTNTTASKVNNLGTIVGDYRTSSSAGAIGFMDSGGTFSTNLFPGGCCTKNNGINDGGDIVGQYRAPPLPPLFQPGPRQGFQDLGGVLTTLDVPGAKETEAEDINNSRDVVGAYKGGGKFGFLYSAGTFTAIAFPGATITEALGINDHGDIVGVYQDALGNLHGFLAVPAAISVLVDVKPTSCPNPLNLGQPGVLPVAVLGTAGFDVSTIDPSSVELQGVPALRSSLQDVATPYTGALSNAYSCTTAGPDGFTDLVLQFNKSAVAATLGPVTNGQVLLLTLTGNLLPQYGGTAIKGQDIVIIVQ